MAWPILLIDSSLAVSAGRPGRRLLPRRSSGWCCRSRGSVVGLFLLDGAEDAGLLAGIEIVDNLFGAGAQGGDLSADLKPGMTM
jgi:hypothetical protein